MGTPGYRSTYLAAFDQANSELFSLYQEYEQLQQRKEKIEDVLMALEPFLSSAAPSTATVHQPEPVITLPVPMEPIRELPDREQSIAVVETAQPVPVQFVPRPETELDPIQRRINSALGLAVA